MIEMTTRNNTGERLMAIETTLKQYGDDIKELKQTTKNIETSMNCLPEKLDCRYTTKEEFKLFKEQYSKEEDRSYSETKQLKRDYIDLAIKVATIGVLGAVCAKLAGVW